MAGVMEALLVGMLGFLKMESRDYCDLETVDGRHTIVSSDGKYGSVIRFNGTKSVISFERFKDMVERLNYAFDPYLKGTGYRVQVVFIRDDDSMTALRGLSDTQKETARKIGLNMEDLINESVDTLRQYTYYEDCHFVLWTTPEVLNDPEIKKIATDRIKDKKEHNIPAMANGQNPFVVADILHNKHNAYVSAILTVMQSGEFACDVSLLDVRRALRAIRKSVLPDITADSWEPIIPGVEHSLMWKSNTSGDDLSEVLPPPLKEQILSRSLEIVHDAHPVLRDRHWVRIGNRVFSPMLIDVPPGRPDHFQKLFDMLNKTVARYKGQERACPYAISMMLEGDGLRSTSFRSMLATIFQMLDSRNKSLQMSVKTLSALREEGLAIVKLSMSAMTWADEGDNVTEELSLREKGVSAALQQWGNPKVGERTGDPMSVVQSTAIGMATRSVAPAAAAPLHDAIWMMPLTRPSSAFTAPSTYMRSLDGKLQAFQFFSSSQTTFFWLISGKPGSGKSVFMNHINLETILMGGQTSLPYACIIDIGASSSGMIDLVKESLPPESQHLVMHARLQNDKAHGINIMDTYLGLRVQLQNQLDNTVAFITALVTPSELAGNPMVGMSNFVRNVVSRAYEKKNPTSANPEPNRYLYGRDELVDQAVEKLGIWDTSDETAEPLTYWDIVDACFDAGMIHEAEVAQRYAVPILNDLVTVAAGLRAEYEHIRTNNDSSLVDEFIRGIRDAVDQYPIFADITQFDIGSSRVVALDLQDVASRSEQPEVNKRSALMYFMACEVFMRKISLHKEMLKTIREQARRYYLHYKTLVDSLIDVKKILVFDEWHVTRNNKALHGQVDSIVRLGRKLQLDVRIASQAMSDFAGMTAFATCFIILDSGDKQSREWMRDNIGLTPEAESAMIDRVHGPSSIGATFLAKFRTSSSEYYQLYTLTLGPKRLWALSTTAEDMRLRSMLYENMPKPAARAILAERFRGGSAKRFIEDKARHVAVGNGFDREEAEGTVVEQLGRDLITVYNNNPGKYEQETRSI